MAQQLNYNAKSLYLQLSQPVMFRFCFDNCIKRGTQINSLNEACLDSCQAKVINVYNFMLNVIESGGIKRDSTVQRMMGSF